MPKIDGRSILIVSLHLVGLTVCCKGTTARAPPRDNLPPHPTDDVIAKNIESFIDDVMACSLAPALTVSAVKDGRVVTSRGYGHTSISKTNRVTSTTKFGIGSLTKAFTALLVAKTVKESDSITLDTPISHFFPDFRLVDDYRSEHASLRDLLGHRVALPRQDTPLMMGIDPAVSREEFTRKLQYLQSPFSFREKFVYNNYMYLVAGGLLERLSDGQAWESLIQDAIFKPLAMTHSGFVDRLTDFTDDFALPCTLEDGSLKDVDSQAFQSAHIAGPAGTIYSSSDDMSKWMTFLLSTDHASNTNTNTNRSRLDVDKSIVEMTFDPSIGLPPSPHDLYHPRFPVSHQTSQYCMGWFAGNYRGYKLISHSGGIVTHSSRLWLFPDSNSGLFVAINGPPTNRTDILTAIPYYISDLLLGLPTWFNVSDVCSSGPMPWHKERKDADIVHHPETSDNSQSNVTGATDLSLWDYVGTYTHPTFGDVIIRLDKARNDSCSQHGGKPERLHFIFGRFGWVELTPESRSVFKGRVYGPLSYINENSVIAVEFSFCEDCNNDNGCHCVRSLSMYVLKGDEKTGPFYKLDGAGHNQNSSGNKPIFSNTFLSVAFYVIISYHYGFIKVFV